MSNYGDMEYPHFDCEKDKADMTLIEGPAVGDDDDILNLGVGWAF